jgi:hypothetical protein
VHRLVVEVADRVFDLMADEAMSDRRTVRDQAAILIEQALGVRPRALRTSDGAVSEGASVALIEATP